MSTDPPAPTPEEQEQAPKRLEEEEAMRGPGFENDDLPGDDEPDDES